MAVTESDFKKALNAFKNERGIPVDDALVKLFEMLYEMITAESEDTVEETPGATT